MLTLEQIQNVTFTKVRGGYAVEEVDEFIDRCVETFSALIEDRNTVTKKMELLADKLVEYRKDEESIHAALVSAQRLGDSIVREANQKADITKKEAEDEAQKILADANVRANETLGSLSDDVKAQQEELERIKREVASFKNKMLAIYKEHLSLINVLPEPAPEEPEEAAPEVVAPAEEPADAQPPVEENVTEEAAEEPAQSEVTELPEDTAQDEPEKPVEDAPGGVSLASVAEDIENAQDKVEAKEAVSSRFADLKFGDDYNMSEDTDDEDDDEEHHGLFRRKR